MSVVICQTNDQEIAEPATHHLPLNQQADPNNSAAESLLTRAEGSDGHLELGTEVRERLELIF